MRSANVAAMTDMQYARVMNRKKKRQSKSASLGISLALICIHQIWIQLYLHLAGGYSPKCSNEKSLIRNRLHVLLTAIRKIWHAIPLKFDSNIGMYENSINSILMGDDAGDMARRWNCVQNLNPQWNDLHPYSISCRSSVCVSLSKLIVVKRA